ncbi:MAG: hypothetical protein KH704_14725 [Clostridiales bacterium]|nr:hypothetical protein [Clostridiales bacterium]
MNKQQAFSYWKYPYQKWLLFLAGVLQLLCLLLNVGEYQKYRRILDTGFLSASQWEVYSVGQFCQCALNGMAAALFFGILLIGRSVRSFQSSRRSEGMLLLCMAALWAVAGPLLRFPAFGATYFFWGLILVSLLFGSAFSFWRSFKKTDNGD